MKITTTVDITDQRIKDLLCSAIEGGSNYWYTIAGYVYPDGKTAADYKGEEDPRYMLLPLVEGGAVQFETHDDDEIKGAKSWLLNLDSIKRGFEVMRDKYPRHFANFISENDDAETGDVFLQSCLFGELVFG